MHSAHATAAAKPYSQNPAETLNLQDSAFTDGGMGAGSDSDDDVPLGKRAKV